MTAKELIEHLQQLPQDTDVYVCVDSSDGELDTLEEVIYDDALIGDDDAHPYPAIILKSLMA